MEGRKVTTLIHGGLSIIIIYIVILTDKVTLKVQPSYPNYRLKITH